MKKAQLHRGLVKQYGIKIVLQDGHLVKMEKM